ncbi:hypothetical protein, partial [Paraburkholderia sp. UYCP14C]|uniref:hypothetical protein n=1 Tax=Paraburkholderia sp. UYCP14C TaxID=2511130 RepID=UPI001459FC30
CEAWQPRSGALPAQTDRRIRISAGNWTRNTPDHRFGPHDEALFNSLLGQQAGGIRRTFHAPGKDEEKASNQQDSKFIEDFKNESLSRGLSATSKRISKYGA